MGICVYARQPRYGNTSLFGLTTKVEWFAGNGGVPGQLYDLAVEWYDLFRPVYGKIYLHHIPEEVFEPPITSSIPNLYWVNFFSKPYVEMIGADRLRTAPCHRIEEMSDGGIMLMLTETPEESISKAGRAKAKEVNEHLGTEYFFDPKTEHYPRRLQERPVPEFDWSRLPKRIPVELPKDIFDGYPPEEIVRNVPELIADLAKRVEHRGITLDYSMESLEQIDSWLEETYQAVSSTAWGEFAESPELLRELTAYIGEIVRLRKNGEWTVEKGDWRPEPVVRFGKGTRKRFRPVEMVEYVMVEGVPESENEPEGIEDTGFYARLWTWI